MYNFLKGTKVKGIYRSSPNSIQVGEVHSEDDQTLWCIDQYGKGPLPWHKDSLVISEIKE